MVRGNFEIGDDSRPEPPEKPICRSCSTCTDENAAVTAKCVNEVAGPVVENASNADSGAAGITGDDTASDERKMTGPTREASEGRTASNSTDDGTSNVSNNAVTDTGSDNEDGDDDDESSGSSVASTAFSGASSQSTLLSEQSDSSSGSILSSASEDEGDGDDNHGNDNDSDDKDIFSDVDARLKRKFAARSKILKRIAKENKSNKRYVEFLRKNEMDVRAETMRILDDRRRRRRQSRRSRRLEKDNAGNGSTSVGMSAVDAGAVAPSTAFSIPTVLMLLRPQRSLGLDPDSRNHAANAEPISATEQSLAVSIMRLMQFESYHTIPGLITLVLYCTAHLSIYELLSNVFLELTKDARNQSLVYAFTFCVSLLLSRLTGGIWGWVNDDTYAAVKFDMHNRLRLRELDARILRWFRRHPVVKCVVDVVSLYLCFMTVAYFLQFGAMPALLNVRDDIVSALPSSRFHFCKTRIREILGDGISYSCSNIDLSEYMNEKACFDDADEIVEDGPYCYNTEELAEALTEEDETYLLSKVSVSSYYAFVGDNRAALTSPMGVIIFFTTTGLLSVGTLFWFGFKFWDMLN